MCAKKLPVEKYSIIKFDEERNGIWNVELVVTSWLFIEKKSISCYFPRKNEYRLLSKWLKSETSFKSTWKAFNKVQILGVANDYDQGLRRLERAFNQVKIDSDQDKKEPKSITIKNKINFKNLINTKVSLESENEHEESQIEEENGGSSEVNNFETIASRNQTNPQIVEKKITDKKDQKRKIESSESNSDSEDDIPKKLAKLKNLNRVEINDSSSSGDESITLTPKRKKKNSKRGALSKNFELKLNRTRKTFSESPASDGNENKRKNQQFNDGKKQNNLLINNGNSSSSEISKHCSKIFDDNPTENIISPKRNHKNFDAKRNKTIKENNENVSTGSTIESAVIPVDECDNDVQDSNDTTTCKNVEKNNLKKKVLPQILDDILMPPNISKQKSVEMSDKNEIMVNNDYSQGGQKKRFQTAEKLKSIRQKIESDDAQLILDYVDVWMENISHTIVNLKRSMQYDNKKSRKNVEELLAQNLPDEEELPEHPALTIKNLGYKMPFEDDDIFIEFNADLSTNKELQTLFKNLLKIWSQESKSYEKSIKNMISKVIDVPVQLLYSGVGRKTEVSKKKDFSGTTAFIFMKHFLELKYKDQANEMHLSKVAGEYLSWAKDRKGGRARRGHN